MNILIITNHPNDITQKSLRLKIERSLVRLKKGTIANSKFGASSYRLNIDLFGCDDKIRSASKHWPYCGLNIVGCSGPEPVGLANLHSALQI